MFALLAVSFMLVLSESLVVMIECETRSTTIKLDKIAFFHVQFLYYFCTGQCNVLLIIKYSYLGSSCTNKS